MTAVRKLLALVAILVLATVLLSGCGRDYQSKYREDAWAVVEMPDGTVMEGLCTEVYGRPDGSVELLIDGAKFRVGWGRVVIMWPED